MNPHSAEFHPWLKKGTDTTSSKHGHNVPFLGLPPRDGAFAEQLLGNASHITAPVSVQNTVTRFSFPTNNYVTQIANVDNFKVQGTGHIGYIPSHDAFGHQLHDVPKHDKVSFVNGIKEFIRNSESEAEIELLSSPWRNDSYYKQIMRRPQQDIQMTDSMTAQHLIDNLRKPLKLDFPLRQETGQPLVTDYLSAVSSAGKYVPIDKTLATLGPPSPWTWGQHDRIVAKPSANEAHVTTESWMPVKVTMNQPSARSSLISLIDERNSDENEETAPPSGGNADTLKNDQPSITRVSVDGTTYDLKPGMVADQFGMFSLLYLIKSDKTNPGSSLLMDGLSRDDFPVNKSERIFEVFCNPWSKISRRPQDTDHNLPNEYRTNAYIKQKLPPIKLSVYSDDLLFYLFYIYAGDTIQMAAACDLYQRGWRYHKAEQLWLERIPGISPITIMDTWEQGTYFYFDVVTWRKHPKQFRIEYCQLEEKPIFFSN